MILHLVGPIFISIIIGGMCGWGYKYGSGARYGKIGHGSATHPPKLDWESISNRKKDIKSGAVLGGIVGLVIVCLTFRKTMNAINEENEN